MSLREMLSDYWYAFQQELFPRLESELGPMGERYELFVAVLELVRVEALLPYFRGQVGRPEEDRAALARAFIAKAVFDVPTTRGLIERLEVDGRLWRLCGWSGAGRLSSEATFSRAFSEFAESRLANRLHETLIARTMDGHLVEHISRDATAIEAREKPAPTLWLRALARSLWPGRNASFIGRALAHIPTFYPGDFRQRYVGRIRPPIPLSAGAASRRRGPSPGRRLSALVAVRPLATRPSFGRVRPDWSSTASTQASLTPDGTRPVSENRHSAMSSLRASATIITRRMRPRAPAVRPRNHSLSALSG